MHEHYLLTASEVEHYVFAIVDILAAVDLLDVLAVAAVDLLACLAAVDLLACLVAVDLLDVLVDPLACLFLLFFSRVFELCFVFLLCFLYVCICGHVAHRFLQ